MSAKCALFMYGGQRTILPRIQQVLHVGHLGRVQLPGGQMTGHNLPYLLPWASADWAWADIQLALGCGPSFAPTLSEDLFRNSQD